jgi:cytochrome d ubiquinol oxidase subunit I
VPNVFVQYWSIRVMAYLGSLMLLIGAWGLLVRNRLPSSRWFLRVAIWTVPLPFVINTAGWVLTENGRQPWIVQGLQRTADGVSPSVGVGAVVTSLVVFLTLYVVLGVVDWTLMWRYARMEPAPPPAASEAQDPALEPTY